MAIKKLLVPLDGSKNSMRGLDKAITLARDGQGTITGVYVVPVYPRNAAEIFMPYQAHLEKQAKKMMSSAKSKCAKSGIVFKSKIIYGIPVIEISDMANKKNFDLVVIGSRGQSGIKEAFLGSVSQGVIHKSKVPVLVVK